MKHTIIICLILIGACFRSNAQNRPPTHDLQRNDSVTTEILIEKKLVELALASPRYKSSLNEITKTQLQVKRAKNSWFDLLNLSTNYNDQTFAKKDGNTTNTYVYPKYFFGLTIPIGMFFSKGAEIKTAKENVKISEHSRDEIARLLKVEILSKYKQYKTYSSLITLESGLSDEQQAMSLQAEKLFSDGKITLESYSNASKTYVNQLANILNLRLQQDIIKLEIESMISVDLEAAIKQATTETPIK